MSSNMVERIIDLIEGTISEGGFRLRTEEFEFHLGIRVYGQLQKDLGPAMSVENNLYCLTKMTPMGKSWGMFDGVPVFVDGFEDPWHVELKRRML